MADITVDTTGYWGDDNILVSGSWSGLAWGDTVTITSGAVCTVDPGQQTPTGVDVGVNIICISSFSTFKLANTSSSAYVFYGLLQGTLRIEAGCSLIVDGNTIDIYTGNGNEDQTTTGWTSTAGYNAADEPGAIEVETGSGTGIYEQWLNVGNVSGGLEAIGVGALGKWFAYNNSTGVFTFGDGGKQKALSSSASSGQKIVNVTDASDFSADDWMHIIEGNTRETIQIDSISVNQITMKTDLVNSYTTSAIIRIGKGGNVVPNGANVRVYTIGIGSKNSGGSRVIDATYNNNFMLDTDTGGSIDLSKLYSFGFYLDVSRVLSSVISRVASLHRFRISYVKGFSINYMAVGANRYTTTTFGMLISYAGYNIHVQNSKFAAIQGYGGYMQNSDDSNVFQDTEFWILNRASSTQYSFRNDNSSCAFDGCKFIGGVYTASMTLFDNCTFSESANAVPTTTYQQRAINGGDYTVNNASFIDDGHQTTIGSPTFDSCLLIKNTNYPCKSSWGAGGKAGRGITVKNCSFRGATTPVYGAVSNVGMLIQNYMDSSYSGNFLTSGSGVIIKGLACQSREVTWNNWAIDSIFYEGNISDTSGFMGLYFNPQSIADLYYAISATMEVIFNGGGYLYIISDNGWVEYTWPHVILGITAFPSGGTINIAGSGYANFLIEYKIDLLDGNGWSGWKTMYNGTYQAATLAAESIDPGRGIKFKVKISRTTGSSSEYLSRLNWQTTVDYDTYTYPDDYVNVTLQNVQDGSRYWVYNATTSKVIAAGVQSGSDDIIIPEVGYNGSNETLQIRVRKGGGGSDDYKPFQTNATLTANGATVWVEQVLDDITQ